MSLGQVRLRPKANKPSINNMSAVNGGLFGREPATYGQRIVDDPYAVVPNRSGGGGGGDLDFLSRVEQAEQRDSARERHRVERKGHQAFMKRHHDGGLMDSGGLVLGGDSTPREKRNSAMYTTSNSATNHKMQQMHEQAVQKHHENTIRQLLVEQHGLSAQDAEHELKLWRQEVASGKAAPIPVADEAPAVPARRAARGENGQFLQQGGFEDPFKVRAARSATPPKTKPWEITNGPNQRSGSSPPQAKVAAWDVADPFKMRSGTPSASAPNHAAGAARGNQMSSMAQRSSQFHVDANASSIAGGIFG